MNFALRRLRWLLRILTVLYWMFLVTLTHLPPSRLPQTHVSDKVAHFTAYSILCALLFLCMWPMRKPTGTIAIIVVVIGLSFGAVDELTQPRFGRTCDIYDWYADAAGTSAAVFLMSLLASGGRRAVSRY